MGETNKNRLELLLQWTVAIVALMILGFILYWHPFYGPMDDHAHISRHIPQIQTEGFYSFFREFVLGDLVWGMFRPVYAVMVYFLYSLPAAMESPTLLYLLNALFVFAILFFSARVFARILQISAWKILVVEAAFFYLHDLFQHPSLQEKIVHLFGFLFLGEVSRPQGRRFSLALLWFLFGISAKASFLIYAAMGGWILLGGWMQLPPQKRAKTFLYSTLPYWIMFIAGFLILLLIARQGNYTQALYSPKKILPNLFSFDGLLFVFPLLAVVCLFFLKKGIPWEAFTPAIGVCAFLVLFLPWGIKGYLHAMAAPFFSALIAWIITVALPQRWSQLTFVFFCMLAVLVTGYRSTVNFSRLADWGSAMTFMGKEMKGKTIFVPCIEGRGALENYLRMRGIREVKFNLLSSLDPQVLDGNFLFFDQGLCPLQGRITEVPGCSSAMLFQGHFAKSYRLVELHCTKP